MSEVSEVSEVVGRFIFYILYFINSIKKPVIAFNKSGHWLKHQKFFNPLGLRGET
jgi:hypothetical protein